jgi:hypothetical protein
MGRSSDLTYSWQVQRGTTSIEYQTGLKKKQTISWWNYEKRWSFKSTNNQELFSCSVKPLHYHPGLKGFFQMINAQEIVFYVDKAYTGSDPCKEGQELFST